MNVGIVCVQMVTVPEVGNQNTNWRFISREEYGSKNRPLGTPTSSEKRLVEHSPSLINCFLSLGYDSSHEIAESLMANSSSRGRRRMPWSRVSKAADKSTATIIVLTFLLAEVMQSMIWRRAVSLEWPQRLIAGVVVI